MRTNNHAEFIASEDGTIHKVTPGGIIEWVYKSQCLQIKVSYKTPKGAIKKGELFRTVIDAKQSKYQCSAFCHDMRAEIKAQMKGSELKCYYNKNQHGYRIG